MSCKKIIWTWYHKLWVEVSISVYGYINIIFISLFCFVLFLYATKKLVGPYGITLKKKTVLHITWNEWKENWPQESNNNNNNLRIERLRKTGKKKDRPFNASREEDDPMERILLYIHRENKRKCPTRLIC